eukprot:TRINITY_DN10967_c0_g1_i2.p1 TRINITY_DN10967_c0_g1~~TRINITY_DN10967_c0_g1_i2.p1  ORF type:complete len:421 (+),score=136.09 TRINITY_DN10967_c0_g1_i2:457-1719(+)
MQLKSGHLVPTIQSVTSAFELGARLVFEDLVPRIRILEFTPSRFGSATLFMNCPKHDPPLKARARLTSKGHVTVTGLKSVDSAVYIAKKICKLFRKVGQKTVRVLNFRVTNMLGLVDLSLPVRLEDFHRAHPEWCTYEPETFPALRLRLLNPKCGVHIFVNGKLNILGLRSQHMGVSAMEKILPLIKPYMGTGSGDYNERIETFFANHTEGPPEVIENFQETLLDDDIAELNENRPSYVHDLLAKGPTEYHPTPKQFEEVKLKDEASPANVDDLDKMKAANLDLYRDLDTSALIDDDILEIHAPDTVPSVQIDAAADTDHKAEHDDAAGEGYTAKGDAGNGYGNADAGGDADDEDKTDTDANAAAADPYALSHQMQHSDQVVHPGMVDEAMDDYDDPIDIGPAVADEDTGLDLDGDDAFN